MNLKRISTFLMVTICFCPLLHAQGNFWDGPDAYLGQSRPSDIPKIFALAVDSGMFAMGRVAFSHDGREIYYTQNDSWESLAHSKIMMVRYADHQWSKPTVVNEEFISPTLSLDGNTLYFRKGNMHNVWQSRRSGDGWSDPAQLLDKSFGIYDFMPTVSGNVYVGSDPSPEDAKNGITSAFSLMTMSGDDVHVKSLGQPLNEPGFNGDLYIAPDESYMIVSARETKTFESELYISFRKPDMTWTVPVNLGPKINDGLAHRWGQFVTADGKYLFYSRGTSEKDCAIYWVRFDKLLESLRPKRSELVGQHRFDI